MNHFKHTLIVVASHSQMMSIIKTTKETCLGYAD